MDWDAVGAMGDVVGAAAVVITLRFLSTQLGQDTKSLDESRAANASQLYQFRAQMHMEGTLRRAEALGLLLPEVMNRMKEEGIDALTPSERMFPIAHATTDAVRLDNGLFQHRSGFLDDDYVAYIRKSIRILAPYWDQIGLFELYPFRQGVLDEVRRIRATDDRPR